MTEQSYADHLAGWVAQEGNYVIDVVNGQVVADPSIPASDLAGIQEILDSNTKYSRHFGVYMVSDLQSPYGPTVQYMGVTSPATDLEQAFVAKAQEVATDKGISLANAQQLLISHPTTYGFTAADIQALESGYTTRAGTAVGYLGSAGWPASYSPGVTGSITPSPTVDGAEPSPPSVDGGEPSLPSVDTILADEGFIEWLGRGTTVSAERLAGSDTAQLIRLYDSYRGTTSTPSTGRPEIGRLNLRRGQRGRVPEMPSRGGRPDLQSMRGAGRATQGVRSRITSRSTQPRQDQLDFLRGARGGVSNGRGGRSSRVVRRVFTGSRGPRRIAGSLRPRKS